MNDRHQAATEPPHRDDSPGPLQVLVVDDDPMMARTLGDILRIRGYIVQLAHTGADALEMTRARRFDCILSDIRMPGMNGVQLYQAIKAEQPDVPMILMTAYATDALAEEGRQAGVLGILQKPLNIHLLLEFMASLARQCSVAIIDDDHWFCDTLAEVLRQRGFLVTAISDPYAVPQHLDAAVDIVLLDVKLDSLDASDVIQELRQTLPDLPVILITGYHREMSPAIETALELGALTCLCKPIEIEALHQLLTRCHHQELGRILDRPARPLRM